MVDRVFSQSGSWYFACDDGEEGILVGHSFSDRSTAGVIVLEYIAFAGDDDGIAFLTTLEKASTLVAGSGDATGGIYIIPYTKFCELFNRPSERTWSYDPVDSGDPLDKNHMVAFILGDHGIYVLNRQGFE